MYYHRFRGALFLLFIPFLMAFCIPFQGIKGRVWIQADTNMPLKDGPRQLGSPYSTSIFVYESATIDQLIGQQENFATKLNANLVKQIKSNREGRFKLKLRPGNYTIVLGYKEGIYIPFFSGSRGVAQFEVLKHDFQEIDITIAAPSLF
jgi:hypothetical protein